MYPSSRNGVLRVECSASVFFSLTRWLCHTVAAAGLEPSSRSIHEPLKKHVKNSKSSILRGVGIVMPARTGSDDFKDQYTLPVSGSSELTDSGCQTISCLTPPALKITGEQ